MRMEKFLKSIDSEGVQKISNANLPTDIAKKLESLLKTDISAIRGREFYYLLNVVSDDFDLDCDLAFQHFVEAKRIKKPPKSKPKKTANRYRIFIGQYTILQQDVADKASIDDTRLSKVLNRTVNDFFAYEVYSIAKSQGSQIKRAFEQLYK